MTELTINESNNVQMPMVRHAAEVGWASVPPPQEALARRGGASGLEICSRRCCTS